MVRPKKIWYILVLLILAVLVFATHSENAGDYVAYDDFNRDDNDTINNGSIDWLATESGAGAEVNITDGVLNSSDGGLGGSVTVEYNESFDADIEGANATFQGYFKIHTFGSAALERLFEKNDADGVATANNLRSGFRIDTNGVVRYLSSGCTWVSAGLSVTTDEWFSLAFTFSNDTRRIAYYVNGTASDSDVGECGARLEGSDGGLERIAFCGVTDGSVISCDNFTVWNGAIGNEPQATGTSQAPAWEGAATNFTLISHFEDGNFSSNWTDNTALSYFIFSTNDTGAWVNETAVAFSSTANISSQDYNVTSNAGETVYWQFYANDSDENWNQTDLQSFQVNDTIAPQLLEISTSVDRVLGGQSLSFHAWGNDTQSCVAIFRFNVTLPDGAQSILATTADSGLGTQGEAGEPVGADICSDLYTDMNLTLQQVSDTFLGNFTDINFTDSFTNTALRGIYYINTTFVQDGYGNFYENTTVINFTVGDIDAPAWSGNVTNATVFRVNDTVVFNATWSDNDALSGFIFSYNDTESADSFTNDSFTLFPAGDLTSSVSLQINQTRGQVFQWLFYANDTGDNADNVSNWNVTDTWLVIINNTLPNPDNITLTPHNIQYNEDANCSSIAKDDDNDDVSEIYTLFYINGTLQQETEGNESTTFTESNFNTGELLSCGQILFDGFENSTEVQSANVTVEDRVAPDFWNATQSADSVQQEQTVVFNVTVNDTSVDVSSVNFTAITANGQTTTIVAMTLLEGQIYEGNFSPPSVTDYNISFAAEDTSGNRNTTAADFLIVAVTSAPAPSSSPSGGGGGGGGGCPSGTVVNASGFCISTVNISLFGVNLTLTPPRLDKFAIVSGCLGGGDEVREPLSANKQLRSGSVTKGDFNIIIPENSSQAIVTFNVSNFSAVSQSVVGEVQVIDTTEQSKFVPITLRILNVCSALTVNPSPPSFGVPGGGAFVSTINGTVVGVRVWWVALLFAAGGIFIYFRYKDFINSFIGKWRLRVTKGFDNLMRGEVF